MALITSAVVVGAAAVGSAAISANAAKKARKAQTSAANDAIGYQRESRDLQLAYQKPAREAGYAATAALMDMTGLSRKRRSAIDAAQGADTASADDPNSAVFRNAFGKFYGMGAGAGADAPAEDSDVPDLSSYDQYNWQTDPGYAFRLSEGNKAIEHSAAARGGMLSGAATKSALRYAQNYASQEYQNVYQRIAAIAGFGQQATNASGNAIQQAGNNISAATMDAGAARASSYVAQGNAWAGAVNQIGQAAGYGMGGIAGGASGMANNYIPKYGAYA